MGFTLASKVSDVTEDYILKSLQYHYPHVEKYKWSSKLIKRFYADFHNKAIQNRWFFGDNVRVTIELPAEALKKDLLEKVPKVKQFCEELAKYGFSTDDAALFIQGKCKKGKQIYKINKAVNEINSSVDLKKAIMNRGIIITKFKQEARTLHRCTITPIVTGDYAVDYYINNINPQNLFNTPLHVLHIINDVLFVRLSTKYVVPIPMSAIEEYSIPDNILNYNIYEDLERVKTSKIIISQDINDYITASSGSFSSCLSIGKCYHFGWQQMWRTPFVWIAFSETELFHKTGRMWIIQKLTHLGEPIKTYKALRFQKPYGQIRDIQQQYTFSYIRDKFNAAFDDKFTGKTVRHNRLVNNFISRNLVSGWGRHAGYFDISGDTTYCDNGENPFYMQPRRGSCLFLFADALDENGEYTTNPNFLSKARNSGAVGVYPDTNIVTTIYGNEVDSSIAIQLSDGRWVSREEVEMLSSSGKLNIGSTEINDSSQQTNELQPAIADISIDDF